MCEVCAELNVNNFLAGKWAKQYQSKEEMSPGFLRTPVATGEMDEIFSAVYYGNEGHAFFAGAGVQTYQDLVNRLWELSRPVDH